jgi:uncharacterized SAM-binding protein YcdF (DUF218 family)
MIQFLILFIISYLSTNLSLKLFSTKNSEYPKLDVAIISLLWTIIINSKGYHQ